MVHGHCSVPIEPVGQFAPHSDQDLADPLVITL